MGLLSLLGAPETDEKFQRWGAATGGNLPQYDAMQMQNQQQRSALAALADSDPNSTPQQLVGSLARLSPEYAFKAAQLQAQNPLASLLQGNGQNGGDLSSLTGDALLAKLPTSVANTIKGYANGTIPISPMTLRTSQGQQLLQLVSQYDPSFDATNYQARAATRKDFTSGKSAQNITAMNTALGHLASLQDAYANLDNSDYPLWNTVANATSSALGGKQTQGAMADVQSKAHAVSEELAKVFRSTGMAESDVKAWEKQINTSSTPAQSKAVIDAAVELLNSRLDALGQQYNQGMGTTKQGIELLSPHAQQAYYKVTGQQAPETGVSGNLAADNAAKSSKIQEGATATNPQTGAKIVFKGGKWVPQ